jgi:hypothetical protein
MGNAQKFGHPLRTVAAILADRGVDVEAIRGHNADARTLLAFEVIDSGDPVRDTPVERVSPERIWGADLGAIDSLGGSFRLNSGVILGPDRKTLTWVG